MHAANHLMNGDPLADRPPFDPVLSLRLDQVIILLDAQPPGLRRRWLQLRKRILELQVPAVYQEGRAR